MFNLDPADPIAVSFKEPVGDEPTGAKNPELLRQKFSHGHDNTLHNSIGRIGYMSGGCSARWVDEDMADTLTARACDFIDRRANEKQPFFLFFALHDIHVPGTPHARFVGITPMGPRGRLFRQIGASAKFSSDSIHSVLPTTLWLFLPVTMGRCSTTAVNARTVKSISPRCLAKTISADGF